MRYLAAVYAPCYINSDFPYMLVFLSVAAFGAGRILGLDAYIERYEIGGVR